MRMVSEVESGSKVEGQLGGHIEGLFNMTEPWVKGLKSEKVSNSCIVDLSFTDSSSTKNFRLAIALRGLLNSCTVTRRRLGPPRTQCCETHKGF